MTNPVCACLQAYTFLNASTVFSERAEESEMDAMLRVVKMPAQEILQVRAGVVLCALSLC